MIYEVSRNEWEAFAATLTDSEKSEGSDYASQLSALAAEISEYLDFRGGAGCGDHGHDKAIKKAQAKRKHIRKVLGYSYP